MHRYPVELWKQQLRIQIFAFTGFAFCVAVLTSVCLCVCVHACICMCVCVPVMDKLYTHELGIHVYGVCMWNVWHMYSGELCFDTSLLQWPRSPQTCSVTISFTPFVIVCLSVMCVLCIIIVNPIAISITVHIYVYIHVHVTGLAKILHVGMWILTYFCNLITWWQLPDSIRFVVLLPNDHTTYAVCIWNWYIHLSVIIIVKAV